MNEVVESGCEHEDSLDTFCAKYAQRVLEMMDRDLGKTASALNVDNFQLVSLVARRSN